jgi:DNA primase
MYNKGFDRQTTLYNSRAVITPSTTDPIWVVEGVADALYLYPHGVAVLGTYTPYQLYLLMQCKDRPVIVVMDGDAHQLGYNFAVALHDLGVWAGCIKLPSRKDPDNMKYDWLYEEAMRSLTIGLF